MLKQRLIARLNNETPQLNLPPILAPESKLGTHALRNLRSAIAELNKLADHVEYVLTASYHIAWKHRGYESLYKLLATSSRLCLLCMLESEVQMRVSNHLFSSSSQTGWHNVLQTMRQLCQLRISRWWFEARPSSTLECSTHEVVELKLKCRHDSWVNIDPMLEGRNDWLKKT